MWQFLVKYKLKSWQDSNQIGRDMSERMMKGHEASTLHEELQTTKECSEQEKYSSPGMSTLADVFPMWNSQL